MAKVTKATKRHEELAHLIEVENFNQAEAGRRVGLSEARVSGLMKDPGFMELRKQALANKVEEKDVNTRWLRMKALKIFLRLEKMDPQHSSCHKFMVTLCQLYGAFEEDASLLLQKKYIGKDGSELLATLKRKFLANPEILSDGKAFSGLQGAGDGSDADCSTDDPGEGHPAVEPEGGTVGPGSAGEPGPETEPAEREGATGPAVGSGDVREEEGTEVSE